ncbi:hypothetical protein [Herbidospora cretacea]|uniref:hypothetical protein n=1 Tax=Herbidospora cretacea TaxID=28444 RepID=UPI000773F2A4|nr:hypothetical protein [Herbidospora cretacea]
MPLRDELKLVVLIWNSTLLLADIDAIRGSGPFEEAFVAPGSFAGAADGSLTALSNFNTRHSDVVLQRWDGAPPRSADAVDLSVRLVSGKIGPFVLVSGDVLPHIDLGEENATWHVRITRTPADVPDDYDEEEDDPMDETFTFQFWPG